MGILSFLKKKEKFKKIVFEGGPGDTFKNAVIIRGASDNMNGVLAEYECLSVVYGKRDQDWEVKKQTLWKKWFHTYDQIDIVLSDGTQRTIFFDITDFFGKW